MFSICLGNFDVFGIKHKIQIVAKSFVKNIERFFAVLRLPTSSQFSYEAKASVVRSICTLNLIRINLTMKRTDYMWHSFKKRFWVLQKNT